MFGAGNYAMSVFYWLEHDAGHDIAAVTVDEKYVRSDEFCGVPMVSFSAVLSLYPPDQYDMFLPISFQRLNRLREERYLQAKANGYSIISYVSSRASTWDNVRIGENCLIGPLCSVEPFATIGNNVTIGPNVVIGHHAVIEDNCFIAPGSVVLGGVTVGKYSLIGANATLKERISVGESSLIGAGATILNDTKPKSVYLGATPRLLDQSSEQLGEWLIW